MFKLLKSRCQAVYKVAFLVDDFKSMMSRYYFIFFYPTVY